MTKGERSGPEPLPAAQFDARTENTPLRAVAAEREQVRIMHVQTPLSSQVDALHIQHVDNGWLVHPADFTRNHVDSRLIRVARTPEELANLISAWALSQVLTPSN